MRKHVGRRVLAGSVKGGLIILFLLALVSSSTKAQVQQVPATEHIQCLLDLSLPGKMSDILSNALRRGLKQPEQEVRSFLDETRPKCSTGEELLKRTAAEFNITEANLKAEVEKFRHCNCKHGPVGSPEAYSAGAFSAKAYKFAENVTLHVALHELGHGVIREFDVPILGNEECMADAFATCYLTTYLPDLAVDALTARTKSLMIEANEVPRQEWSVRGEHNNDARRAYQIAALAMAADPQKYAVLARVVGMSDSDIRKSRDYAAEIHRSWRRILKPLWMPDGVASNEGRVRVDPDCEVATKLCSNGLAKTLESVVKRFDWHSQVTVRFVNGEGGAGWSRSDRTATVHSDYLIRFIEQGKVAGR